MPSTYTVRELTERYGVSEHTVLAWIRRGELAALDVSPQKGGKPKWRVTAEALAAFEALRTASVPATNGKRRKNRPADVIEFYK